MYKQTLFLKGFIIEQKKKTVPVKDYPKSKIHVFYIMSLFVQNYIVKFFCKKTITVMTEWLTDWLPDVDK